jgi:hypothetical protein
MSAGARCRLIHARARLIDMTQMRQGDSLVREHGAVSVHFIEGAIEITQSAALLKKRAG